MISAFLSGVDMLVNSSPKKLKWGTAFHMGVEMFSAFLSDHGMPLVQEGYLGLK